MKNSSDGECTVTQFSSNTIGRTEFISALESTVTYIHTILARMEN